MNSCFIMLLYCSREAFMTIWKAHAQGWLGMPDNHTRTGHKVALVVLLGIWETVWYCKKSEFSSRVLVMWCVATMANTPYVDQISWSEVEASWGLFPAGPPCQDPRSPCIRWHPNIHFTLWAAYLLVISGLSDLLNYNTTQWNRYSKTGFQH